MVHIVCKVTVQRSGGLGFCLADSTQFRYVLNSVSQIFAEKNFKKADSSHRLWRLCSLCSSFGVLEPCIQFGNLRANSPFSPRAFIRTFSCFWCTSTSSLPFKQDIVLLFEFAITLFLLIKIQQQRPRTSEIAGYIKICTLMVYKPRLVALWICFIRVQLPVSHSSWVNVFAAGHVACHRLWASVLSQLNMNWSCHPSLAGYAWVANSRTGTGPWARGRILRTKSLLHVTTPAALHATSRTGACAQSQSCPGRGRQATVMPVAAGPPGPGLLAKVQFNMLYNNLRCYITWVKSTKMLNRYLVVISRMN